MAWRFMLNTKLKTSLIFSGINYRLVFVQAPASWIEKSAFIILISCRQQKAEQQVKTEEVDGVMVVKNPGEPIRIIRYKITNWDQFKN